MTSVSEELPSRMLIGRDRLFYSGLVGNSMKTRRLGAVTIYAAVDSDIGIRVADGPWGNRRIVALTPYLPHMLRTRSGQIANICLESKSIDPNEIVSLIMEINAREDHQIIERVADARREIVTIGHGNGFSAREFDEYFLRRALKPRAVDPRIQFVVDTLIDALQDKRSKYPGARWPQATLLVEGGSCSTQNLPNPHPESAKTYPQKVFCSQRQCEARVIVANWPYGGGGLERLASDRLFFAAAGAVHCGMDCLSQARLDKA